MSLKTMFNIDSMWFFLLILGIKISINQNKDPETNIVKLKLLLVEILISVYMSLLIYALSTDDCNTLYRLLKRKWSTADSAVKLWYGVFGGGAKKPLACKSTSPNTTSSSGWQQKLQ